MTNGVDYTEKIIKKDRMKRMGRKKLSHDSPKAALLVQTESSFCDAFQVTSGLRSEYFYHP